MTGAGGLTLSGPVTPDGAVTWAVTLAAEPVPRVIVEWNGPAGGVAVAYAQLGAIPAMMWMLRVPGEGP
ncbi:MAG: hypothetical protein AAFQ51_15990 [Pseudomonadota bacterium]